MSSVAHFRFYEELNDFLPPERKKTSFSYRFSGSPAVKDAVEAMGVPHPEVDLIVVNGESVGFDYHLREGDRVAVYPVFESIDISPVVHLRAEPLREPRFVVDDHLGKLARRLRMLGFDTLYEKDSAPREIIDVSVRERRIILTRDRTLLKAKSVSHGYWLRATDPNEQTQEVLDRFDLRTRLQPFNRCTLCNGLIRPIDKEAVLERIPAKTRRYVDEYFQCSSCRKLYWKGTHYGRMRAYVDRLRKT